MGNIAAAAPERGDGLADRYRLGEQIGAGGVGRVYRARDDVLERDVAVKVLDGGAAGDAEFGRACAAEARAAAALTHPNVARVFDSAIRDGRGFIVMELVPGRTLRQILAERGTLPPAEAIAIALPLADALDEAHRQGVVHCDVKPGNVVVTPDGVPKLVDFGIAQAASAWGPTDLDEIRGSAPYMAPEQVRSERVDGKADVYALGAVLYEMLTGRPPCQAATVAALLSQALFVDPPPPRSLNPAVWPALERVVLTALARDRRRRYAADAFRDALRAAAAAQAAAPRARGVAIRSGPAPAQAKAVAARPRVRGGAAHIRRPVVALLLLGLGGLLAGVPAGRDRRTEAVSQPTQPTLQAAVPPTVEPAAQPSVEPTARPPTAAPTAAPPARPTAQGQARPPPPPRPAAPPEPAARPQPPARPQLAAAPQPAAPPRAAPATEPPAEPVRERTDPPTAPPAAEPAPPPPARPPPQPTPKPPAQPAVAPTPKPPVRLVVEPGPRPPARPGPLPAARITLEPPSPPRPKPAVRPERDDARQEKAERQEEKEARKQEKRRD
jgi:eukaryotic-like serine/threonine-protein kinase